MMVTDEIQRLLDQAENQGLKPTRIRLSQRAWDELIGIIKSALGPYDVLKLEGLSIKGTKAELDTTLGPPKEVRVDTYLGPQL